MDKSANNESSLLKQALLAIQDREARLEQAQRAQREPIAVIGMGCRFPGDATNADTYWDLLRSGRDAISAVPGDRWDADAYFDTDPDKPGKAVTRRGGFLEQVDEFDPGFFEIAPREAAAMDPQQRLALEVAWETLENVGYAPANLQGTLTGIFLGIASNDFSQITGVGISDAIDIHYPSGVAHSIAAGRISYVLGLQGPSIALDTACSSSLVAVHIACQSLRSGDCHLALAGGVNVMLAPETTSMLSRLRMLSPEGTCRTFDESANGFVRGEGCGFVALKRLSQAEADGDRILAIIRGSAVNQDGASSSLTAPNGPSQEALMRKALLNAGLSPSAIGYVEAHGTGTPLGDPIELQALGAVYGAGRAQTRPLLAGSVKTNMGHLEAAAGIAGLIKLVLALQHRQIPPHLHLKRPTSHVNWNALRIAVPQKLTDWESEGKTRVAAVSSFGFSGTNAHVIVEESSAAGTKADENDWPVEVLTASAKSEPALMAVVAQYRAWLEKHPDAALRDVCFTANTGRSHFAYRASFMASDIDGMTKELAAFSSPAKSRDKSNRIGYLFTGQGSQYAGMGRELWESSPVFRAAVERCASFWKQETGESLEAVLYGAGDSLEQARQAQPALFALEYGLSELWRSCGIEPSVVLGHSLGEYVAAVVAGIFSLEDGLRLVQARAELMDSLATRGAKPGAMHAVSATVERVEQALQGLEQEVGIAAINGPSSIVISGAVEAVAEASRRLAGEGIRTRPLQVTHAFHSPLLEPILAEFERRAERITYREPRLRVVSNVTGRVAAAGEMSHAGYWRRHMRSTVLFHAGLQAALATGCSTLLEIGPQPHLSTLGKLAEARPDLLWLPSLRKGRNGWLDLFSTVCGLYEAGFDIQWAAVHGRGGRKIALPTYPFQRHRYPVPKSTPSARSSSRTDVPGAHPLLGTRLPSPLEEIQFQSRIGPDRPVYLTHHEVQGKPVVPAAAYLEIALSAAKAIGMDQSAIRSAAILQPCVFDMPRTLQCVLKSGGPGRTFAIYSSAEESQDGWVLHATGEIVSHDGESASDIPAADLAAIRARCSHKLEVAAFYRAFEERGLTFGPAFRPLTQIVQGSQEALVEFEIPSVAQESTDQYQIHPVALDACLQAVAAAAMAANEQNGGLYLPSGLEKLELLGDCRGMAFAHAVLRGGRGEQLRADFHGFNREGMLVLRAEGLVVRPLPQQQPDALQDLFYEIEWLPLPNDAQHLDLSGSCLVLGSEASARHFAVLLKQQGIACTTAQQSDLFVTGQTPDTGAYVKVLERARLHGLPLSDVVYIAPAPQKDLMDSGDEAAELESTLLEECLTLSQALVTRGEDRASRFWIVTQGGQGPKLTNVAHAALWGFGRSIALEHPEMRTVRIDLDSAGDFNAQQLLQTMIAAGDEDELVVRGGHISVPRLRRKESLVPSGKSPAEANLQLTLVQPGTIDGLQLLPALRREPGDGEVEIEVRAAGLNFRDVLCALGIYKGKIGPLGGECAGVVVKLGPGVSGLQAGDEVIALARGCFGRFVTTKERLVWHKPPHLSFETSVTIPVAFLTARYALENIAQIRPGESVLVHAGAGGVGLAAIQVAQKAGAAIYATAGSEEKRAYLRSLGIAGVFDSRSLEFAHELRTATGGKGVDVVLNSLTGAFIDAGIEILTPSGRFVELGVAELRSPASVKAIRPDVSYHAVQLAGEIEAASDLVHGLIEGLIEQFASGALQPLPRELFPLEQVHDAFRYMAQARHIGRVIVCPGHETQTAAIRGDGAYLVTGGSAGLGLKVAEWLSAHGAGEVIAMGRNLPSAEAAALFEAMRMQGTAVTVCQGDVSQAADVQRALCSQLPMRGVFHCAGIVDDGVLLQQNRERFQRVLAPKVGGACHLHRLTRNSPLDHFVLFSSIAGPLGSPGQSNYASANALLDAVAHYRRAHHLPALSIDWGAWSETGMAVRHKVIERSAETGMLGISTREGLSALETLLSGGGGAQTIVASVNWPLYLANAIPPGQRNFLSGLQSSQKSQVAKEKSPAKQESWMPRLESVAKSRWKDLLAQLIEEKIRLTLRLDLTQPIMPRQPLQELGLDSLLSIELRNALGIAVSRTLPATLLFNYPTLEALTDFLFRELGGDVVPGSTDRKAKPVRRSLIEDIESLSDDEVNRMLGEKAMGGVL